MAWPKGKPRDPANRGGRQRGTLNKTTRAAKEFMAELCDDAAVQAAVRDRILNGDAALFFRAVEQVLGKPLQKIQADIMEAHVIPGGVDVAEE